LKQKKERNEKRRYVLLAKIRFENAVHAHDGSEEEKVAAAKLLYPTAESGFKTAEFLRLIIEGGGAKGVLSHILRFV